MLDEMLDTEVQTETDVETDDSTNTETNTVDTDTDTSEEIDENTNSEIDTDEEVNESTDTDTETEIDTDSDTEVISPVIRVKYNKQERQYSVDEATPLVQMGLKYESQKEEQELLKDLAAAYGVTVKDFVKGLSKNADDALYQQTLTECDGNETVAKKLFTANKAERDRKITALREEESKREQLEVEEEQNKLSRRLADDFINMNLELKKDGKSFKDFSEIPQKVLEDAVKNDRSLYDSYLRFEKSELRKSEVVKKKQEETAKTTTGSLHDKPNSTPSEFDAIMKNIWG